MAKYFIIGGNMFRQVLTYLKVKLKHLGLRYITYCIIVKNISIVKKYRNDVAYTVREIVNEISL